MGLLYPLDVLRTLPVAAFDEDGALVAGDLPKATTSTSRTSDEVISIISTDSYTLAPSRLSMVSIAMRR